MAFVYFLNKQQYITATSASETTMGSHYDDDDDDAERCGLKTTPRKSRHVYSLYACGMLRTRTDPCIVPLGDASNDLASGVM